MQQETRAWLDSPESLPPRRSVKEKLAVMQAKCRFWPAETRLLCEEKGKGNARRAGKHAAQKGEIKSRVDTAWDKRKGRRR